MYFDKIKNHISFKLDLLEGYENEKVDDITKEDNKNNKINNYNPYIENINNTSPYYFNIHKVSTKFKSLKEKEVENVIIKIRILK